MTRFHLIFAPPLVAAALLLMAGGPKPTPMSVSGVAGPVRIERGGVRPAAQGLPASAAYLTLRNTGRKPDSLISVTTSVAAMAGVHVSVSHKGVMSMEPIGALPLPPGAAIELKPGGLHVMLDGLRRPLKVGEAVPLTFRFKTSAPVSIMVPVQAKAPPGPPEPAPPKSATPKPVGRKATAHKPATHKPKTHPHKPAPHNTGH
ncbi:hypothetical protein BH09PSE2_BH09PSE2_13540 [soil metagenome]